MMVGIMVGMTIVSAFVMRCNLNSYVVNGREIGIFRLSFPVASPVASLFKYYSTNFFRMADASTVLMIPSPLTSLTR